MLGSGECSGRTPVFVHIGFQGAANGRPQFTPLPRTPPSSVLQDGLLPRRKNCHSTIAVKARVASDALLYRIYGVVA